MASGIDPHPGSEEGQDHEAWLKALDAAIERGLAEAERGDFTPAEEVFDRLRKKYAAMIKD